MKEANRKEGKMGDEANACVHNDRNDIQIKYSRWFLLSNTPTRCLLRSVPKVGASALNVQRDPRNEINHTHTHTHLFGQRSSRYFHHFSLLFYRRMCNNRDESKRNTSCRRNNFFREQPSIHVARDPPRNDLSEISNVLATRHR